MNVDITPPDPMSRPPQTGPGGRHGVGWGENEHTNIEFHIVIITNINIHIVIAIDIAIDVAIDIAIDMACWYCTLHHIWLSTSEQNSTAAAVGPGPSAVRPGGSQMTIQSTKRLYKCPTDYTKPRQTMQSPERRYKAPTY